MGENSKIAWTDYTFNPMIGCRKVSAECDHCYADRFARRYKGHKFTEPWRTKTTWKHPRKWNAAALSLDHRPRVFCASLTDVFLQEMDEYRAELWDMIRECTNLDWLILTKRTKLAASRLPADWGVGWPHVWLGTTCGCKQSLYRVDELRALPAAVRFISAEPLLESIKDMNLQGINWLIAGGESGSGFRVMQDAWAIELRNKCKAEGIGFFFKQHSAFRPGQGQLLEGVEYHESPMMVASK